MLLVHFEISSSGKFFVTDTSLTTNSFPLVKRIPSISTLVGVFATNICN